jgi:hypothetical protein
MLSHIEVMERMDDAMCRPDPSQHASGREIIEAEFHISEQHNLPRHPR